MVIPRSCCEAHCPLDSGEAGRPRGRQVEVCVHGGQEQDGWEDDLQDARARAAVEIPQLHALPALQGRSAQTRRHAVAPGTGL